MKTFGTLEGHYTAPARGGTPSSFIMILHGWGADGNDLADLARPLAVRFPGAAFFVPHAPDPCSMNPMGRQWFDIDDRVNGPLVAAPVIDGAIQAACDELGISHKAVALLGFSQGGMMSLHCGLHAATPPAAVVSFSGALLVHDHITPHAPTHPAVQLIHGTDDMVVPFDLMAVSEAILIEKGVTVETVARPGLGHGIDPDGLTAAINFLAQTLPA